MSLLEWGVGNAITATLLALVVAAVAWFWRRRPAVRHALWALVLAKFLLPPLLPLSFGWVEEVEPAAVMVAPVVEAVPGALPVIETAPAPASTITTWSVADALALLWLAGVLAVVTLAVFRVARFRRVLARATPAPTPLQARADELARRLGLRKAPGVLLLDARLSPLLWALGRARLVLPRPLLDKIDAPALDALLLHEIAHYRRRDHWIRVLEFACTALFWWCPTVWLARRELHRAEEAACDAWVLALAPRHTKAYATALVDCAALAAPAPVGATALFSSQPLKQRIESIMREEHTPRRGRLGTLVLVAAAFLLVPFVVLEAQEAPAAPKPPAKDASAFAKQLKARVVTHPDFKKLPADLRSIMLRIVDDVTRDVVPPPPPPGVRMPPMPPVPPIAWPKRNPGVVPVQPMPPVAGRDGVVRLAAADGAMLLSMGQDRNPVPAGQSVTYKVIVRNMGGVPARNLKLHATMAEGMRIKSLTGPTRARHKGTQIVFDPVPALAAGAQLEWKIELTQARKGTGSLRVDVRNDQARMPVSGSKRTKFE